MKVRTFKVSETQYSNLKNYDQRYLVVPQNNDSIDVGDYLMLNAWNEELATYMNPEIYTTGFIKGSDTLQPNSSLLFEITSVESFNDSLILSIKPVTHVMKRALIRGQYAKGLISQ